MNITFEARKLFASDDEAFLVMHDTCLVAIVVRLSEVHLDNEGDWSIEWASEDRHGSREIFHTFSAATDWISQNLRRISN